MAPSVDAEFFQPVAQGAKGHAQPFGSSSAVPAGFFEGLLDQLALDAFQIVFQIVDAGEADFAALCAATGFRQAQVTGLDMLVFAQGVSAFEHVFQLADVAGEAVTFQLIQRLAAELGAGQAAALGEAGEHALGQ